jgi:hypothetical protein
MSEIQIAQGRIEFFHLLFGSTEGYVCIATKNSKVPAPAGFSQEFFKWPLEGPRMEKYINIKEKDHDVYFCVNELSRPERRKPNCLETDLIWADLDEVEPMSVQTVPPTIVIKSSATRYQALWKLNEKIDPHFAETYSKRVAYSIGADVSGWDLTQLLRVPFTWNFKYDPPERVYLLSMPTETTPLPIANFFDFLPATEDEQPVPDEPIPDLEFDVGQVLYKYRGQIHEGFSALFTQEPDENSDWSKLLWKLINMCFDAGMTREEVFLVVDKSACNKYARDNRPKTDLWRDVLKAERKREEVKITPLHDNPLVMPKLVDESELTKTLIDEYREWATSATDAVPEYHDLCFFVMLSAIIATSVMLPLKNENRVPNLWGMVLGNSTTARKTTSMRMSLNLLNELDPEIIVATEGTPEGIMKGLAARPHKASIFFRDEVSGLFAHMNKREYGQGSMEAFAHLYDYHKFDKKVLSKETITLQEASFIFLAGGVTDRVFREISDQYITSGFIPRFLVVIGEVDKTRLKDEGPPVEEDMTKRNQILDKLADLFETYATEITTHIQGQPVNTTPRIIAELTPEAWDLHSKYGRIMWGLGEHAINHELVEPMFERLRVSLSKLAIILGAIRQKPNIDGHIVINAQDLKNAAGYIQEWGKHSIKLIVEASKVTHQKMAEKVFRAVLRQPGISRTELRGNMYKPDRKVMDEAIGDLIEAGLIRSERRGKGTYFYPL